MGGRRKSFELFINVGGIRMNFQKVRCAASFAPNIFHPQL
jgi:hypothetical protein